MTYKIIWSKTAEIDYIKNIDFLLKKWYKKSKKSNHKLMIALF